MTAGNARIDGGMVHKERAGAGGRQGGFTEVKSGLGGMKNEREQEVYEGKCG